MSTDATVIEAIVRGILEAYWSSLLREFDLPWLGQRPWFLYLSILLGLGMVLLVWAKAIAVLVSLGRRR